MVKIYSHSKLSSFEQCRLKFKYRYIDRITVIEKSIEAFLGGIVHNALEWLYKQVESNKIPTIDDVITYYATNWKEKYKPNIIIVKKEFTVKDYFNKGVEFLINYYTTHKPFDDNTLEIEKKIVIYLDEFGEYRLHGFIDRLVHNLEKDEYEIHDYKTANNLPSKEQIDNDRQLALYSIAIKDLVGQDKEVALVWHYLAHNKKIHSKRTNEQLEQLKKETLELIKKIESTTEFPYNKTVLCGWCEYKSMCPAYKEVREEIKEEVKEEGQELDIW